MRVMLVRVSETHKKKTTKKGMRVIVVRRKTRKKSCGKQAEVFQDDKIWEEREISKKILKVQKKGKEQMRNK